MAPQIRVSRLIRTVFGVTLAATVLIGLIQNVGAVSSWEGRTDITDFHAFYLVGQLISAGQFQQAYHASAMLALETALGGGRPVFMPWSYPPLFGLVVAGLAALPLGGAFVLFTVATLGVYLWGTSRLDAEGRWPVMLACVVSIVLNLRCGQNGLLTAGLVAAACAFLLSGRQARSGLCLGLMTIKPHLVPLLPIMLMAQRRWQALAVAAAAAFVLTGFSVAIFGAAVFAAFVHALPDVGRLMAIGAYPIHRMTSIFVFCMGIGMPPWAASVVHCVVAVLVLAATAALAWRRTDPRLGFGLAILAGFFVSPYIYDYDFVLFGVGLMLVSPALRSCVSPKRYIGILAGCAGAQSLGLVLNPLVERNPDLHVSLAGPAVLAVFCSILWPLWTTSRRPAGVLASARAA